MDTSGETCGEIFLFPTGMCRDGYGRNLPRPGDVRVPQQFKDREAVRTGHLYVGQQKIILLPFQAVHQFPDIRAAVIVNPAAREHLPGDLQLDAVVIHDQHTDAAGRFTGRKHLLFQRGGLSGRWHGKENGEAAAFTGDALYLHTAPHFRHEPGRDRQPQSEPWNATRVVQPFERPEYPFFLFCAYSHAGIPDRDAKFPIQVFRLKAHLPVGRKLQGVGQQVVGYLPDMRAVTADDGVQTGEGYGEH